MKSDQVQEKNLVWNTRQMLKYVEIVMIIC